jgi:aminomethyltransferase
MLVTNIKNASNLSKNVFKSLKYKRSFATDTENLVKTALYDMHLELGGDMVPFAGYTLPVLYKGENGGVMKEHLWCREEGKASLFDVSHMGQVGSYLSYPFVYLGVVILL